MSKMEGQQIIRVSAHDILQSKTSYILVHYATDYALFSCIAIETKAYLYVYMHIHAFFG